MMLACKDDSDYKPDIDILYIQHLKIEAEYTMWRTVFQSTADTDTIFHLTACNFANPTVIATGLPLDSGVQCLSQAFQLLQCNCLCKSLTALLPPPSHCYP